MTNVPAWKRGPLDLQRPVARPQLLTREARLACPALRAAFTVYVKVLQQEDADPWVRSQALFQRPCSWCGLPTGCYCDGCNISHKQPLTGGVCTRCDNEYGGYCPYCVPAQALQVGWVSR